MWLKRIINVFSMFSFTKDNVELVFITAKSSKTADPANKLMLMSSIEIAFN